MNDIRIFDRAMWDGWAGCEPWPDDYGVLQGSEVQPVYCFINNMLVIADNQSIEVSREVDGPIVDNEITKIHEHLNLPFHFESQRKAIEYLRMINPTEWIHFDWLGFK